MSEQNLILDIKEIEIMKEPELSSYIIQFSYLGIFLWFFIGQQLTPIPEEVSLISLGYVSTYTNLNILLSGIIALLASLAMDSLLFYLSGHKNKFIVKLTSKINSQKTEKIKKKILLHRAKTLFVLKLIPKLRLLSPVISGIAGVSFKYFSAINFLASLTYISLYMAAGYYFYQKLYFLEDSIPILGHYIFIAIMAVLAVFIIMKIYRLTFRFYEKNK